jgi:hypothetical protein
MSLFAMNFVFLRKLFARSMENFNQLDLSHLPEHLRDKVKNLSYELNSPNDLTLFINSIYAEKAKPFKCIEYIDMFHLSDHSTAILSYGARNIFLTIFCPNKPFNIGSMIVDCFAQAHADIVKIAEETKVNCLQIDLISQNNVFDEESHYVHSCDLDYKEEDINLFSKASFHIIEVPKAVDEGKELGEWMRFFYGDITGITSPNLQHAINMTNKKTWTPEELREYNSTNNDLERVKNIQSYAFASGYCAGEDAGSTSIKNLIGSLLCDSQVNINTLINRADSNN